jgi:multimeric flavodoxin WrbA/putative sterol carrier protein
MKVLSLNSSPRGDGQSKTELLLNHLVQGMKEAGAEVEVVPLRRKKIRYCSGCFTCWTKTPGKCIHQDDMTRELFPKWLAADLVIYAAPLYHFHLNAQMKTFVERTLPAVLPFFEYEEERTTHPLRHSFPKAVVLSVAGFPDMEAFDQLSAWVRFVFGREGRLVAEIYRPAAESLPRAGAKAEEIFAAFRQAGREIVEQGALSPETLALVTKEIGKNREQFALLGNAYWKTCIAEKITPKEFDERDMIPRPDSVETFLIVMSLGFNKEAAREVQAVIQFRFSGEVKGNCYFRIDQGELTTALGEGENPDLIINAPFEVWMDILTGKADGAALFMEGKYTVEGDPSLLMHLSEWFGKGSKAPTS